MLGWFFFFFVCVYLYMYVRAHACAPTPARVRMCTCVGCRACLYTRVDLYNVCLHRLLSNRKKYDTLLQLWLYK